MISRYEHTYNALVTYGEKKLHDAGHTLDATKQAWRAPGWWNLVTVPAMIGLTVLPLWAAERFILRPYRLSR